MSRSRRLVLLDPGLASAVGHHADLNGLLLPSLIERGWAVELWADAAAAAEPALAQALPGLRPLLSNAGYIDPRHWGDLPGSLHQAALLRPQLQAAAASGTGAPVAVWLAHSLVPFQLIALAQLLQTMPPALVLISLMFAPGEVFGGQPEHDLQAQRQLAETCSRTALAALAMAAARGGHQLLLAAGSQTLIERYRPFCQAAGLAEPRLHPAVVVSRGPDSSVQPPRRQLLLHWGERKPDKGRELGLALLAHRLEGGPCPPALEELPWCFHASSRREPEPAEAALLQRARADPRCRVLEGQVSRPQMLEELACSELALMAYCPQAYAERSSGVLWLYGAARLACGRPARLVGRPGGWLAREAPALGLVWRERVGRGLLAAAEPGAIPAAIDGMDWIDGMAATEVMAVMEVMAEALVAPAPAVSPYGREVLNGGFGSWLADQLDGLDQPGGGPGASR